MWHLVLASFNYLSNRYDYVLILISYKSNSGSMCSRSQNNYNKKKYTNSKKGCFLGRMHCILLPNNVHSYNLLHNDGDDL